MGRGGVRVYGCGVDPGYRYAYVHGFASSAHSYKGTVLRERFAESGGVERWLPDFNRPSFGELSHAAMLAHMDEVDQLGDRDAPWRLIGSSLGGWLAARWAELRPDRVDRLLLLCPGFGLAQRWPEMLGAAKMDEWARVGSLPFPDATGTPVPVHYAFFEESLREVAAPEVPCKTVIVHGSRDEVVPVESSRRYARPRPHVTLLEVDDDHGLAASIEVIELEARRLFA